MPNSGKRSSGGGTWSDGTNTIAEMPGFVRQHYDYEYSAVTDHSKSQTQATGLDESGFRKQHREIAGLNRKMGSSFIWREVQKFVRKKREALAA